MVGLEGKERKAAYGPLARFPTTCPRDDRSKNSQIISIAKRATHMWTTTRIVFVCLALVYTAHAVSLSSKQSLFRRGGARSQSRRKADQEWVKRYVKDRIDKRNIFETNQHVRKYVAEVKKKADQNKQAIEKNLLRVHDSNTKINENTRRLEASHAEAKTL